MQTNNKSTDFSYCLLILFVYLLLTSFYFMRLLIFKIEMPKGLTTGEHKLLSKF